MSETRLNRLVHRHNTVRATILSIESEMAAGTAKDGPWSVVFRKVRELAGDIDLTDGLSDPERAKWVAAVEKWIKEGTKKSDGGGTGVVWVDTVLTVLRTLLTFGAPLVARLLVSWDYGTTPYGRLAKVKKTLAHLDDKITALAQQLRYRVSYNTDGTITVIPPEAVVEGLIDGGADDEASMLDWSIPAFHAADALG